MELTIRTDPKESKDSTAVFNILLGETMIGVITIRTVELNWPAMSLLRFLNSPVISKMFKPVYSGFWINYFWLEMLWIEEPYRGNGYAVEALNIAMAQMPAYSVIVGYPHEVADTKLEDILKFYKKHNFHILEDTIGNPKDKMVFTFVRNK